MRAIVWLSVLVGCASEEAIQEDWDAFVAEHQSCEVAEDCVVIYPGCPLGCFVAVSADAEQEAIDEAEKLISRYERGGRVCMYDCLAAGEPTCDAGVCAVEGTTGTSSTQ